MKLFALLACLVAAPVRAADYFSEGWTPGQAVRSQAPSAAFVPGAQPTASQVPGYVPQTQDKIVDKILSSGPVAGLFSKMGVNVTERIEAAKLAQANMWDRRIPLITDDNWRDLLVNEQFASEEEEKSRVWFIIMYVFSHPPYRSKANPSFSTGQMSQPEGLSKFVDKYFDGAYNLTMEKNDLPNVRWGRIDYLNVTELTTRWNIWQYVACLSQSTKTAEPPRQSTIPRSQHGPRQDPALL
jgi:hypothetical protein